MTLLKNTSWNIIGTAVSALAMIPVIAYVARELDVESFGLLTLVLSFVGYATVLDAGVARAAIREIARNRSDLHQIATTVGTAFWLVVVCALVGTTLLVSMSSEAVQWLNITSGLQSSAVVAFKIGSCTVVPLLLTALWNAPLEGLGRFGVLNLVRGVGYIAMFVMVGLAVYIQASLVSAVIGLLIGRVLMAVMSMLASRWVLGGTPLAFDRHVLKRLYAFGGWLTLSNVISPVMDYVDRFVVSSIAGAREVAYYSAPADLVTKLSAVPHALSRALFPQLSVNTTSGLCSATDIKLSIKVQILLGLGVFGAAVLFGEQIMGVWLGAGYAETSGAILKLLSFGFLCNSCNLVPYTALQAAGYSKLTAMVYLVELVPYLLVLVVLVNSMGVYGAAIAWCIKCVFELAAFYWLYKKHLARLA